MRTANRSTRSRGAFRLRLALVALAPVVGPTAACAAAGPPRDGSPATPPARLSGRSPDRLSDRLPDPGRMGAEELALWRAHLTPDAAETAWRRIPWRTTLTAGVRDAAERDRPLLLWVMNGHPLGCT